MVQENIGGAAAPLHPFPVLLFTMITLNENEMKLQNLEEVLGADRTKIRISKC